MAPPKPVDTHALAAIRPGDPKEKLAAAIGDRWREPRPEEAGWIRYLEDQADFVARLDRDGRVGRVEFGGGFDEQAAVEGLRMGMQPGAIAAASPRLVLGDPIPGLSSRYGRLELGGAELTVELRSSGLSRIAIEDPSAIYPEPALPPLPRPTLAFDVEAVRQWRSRGTRAPHGWCFGLPRGITPAQWPLSHNTGFPLEHHFTVWVPPPYRVKGDAYVALAFFSDTTSDYESSTPLSDLMDSISDGRAPPTVVDPDLQPFRDHLRGRHPMEFKSRNMDPHTCAAIWLTEPEFGGVECEPPGLIRTGVNATMREPLWLTESAAERLVGRREPPVFTESGALFALAGDKLRDRWDIRLLRMREVGDDPNTGRTPVDSVISGPNPDGYVPEHSEEWDALGVELDYSDLHFGGTASPCQAMPELTPFYIEFEEQMGMINFGGGNAQLDLVTMQIDWAH